MPLLRAAFLTALLLLVAAAPASASERSEARKYAAAMERDALTPDEAEALVAGMEARGAHAAATCLPTVQAAAKKKRTRTVLELLYGYHLVADGYARMAAWMAEGDARLLAIPTRAAVLRRGRASRRAGTAFLQELAALAPKDFCAVATAWEARGFKGEPPESEAITEVFVEFLNDVRGFRQWVRAVKVLKRHGATPAQRHAFFGDPGWPDLREPAHDVVAETLEAKRAKPDDVPSRTPW